VCTDEVCTLVSGCVYVPNALDCDDGLFCTGDDACAGGTCSVHSGSPCSGFPECRDVCDEPSRGCVAPFFYPCSSDGNSCTEDVCNGLGSCTHLPSNGSCDDGVFCNGPDFCSGGACLIHAGDPCSGGADCFDACDESTGACLSPAGSACSDDGNVCTDDSCDGGGTCLHEPNTSPCDDGDFCTISDQCSGGSCQAGDISPMQGRFVFSRKTGINNDRALFKATIPLAAQSASPSTVGVVVQLRDQDEAPLYDATIPAIRIEDAGGKGKVFKFRDKDKTVPEANGIITAIFKRNVSKGEVRVKIRTRDYEMPQVIDRPRMSLSLLFGADPVIDECLTADGVPCVTKGGRKVKCRE
jgi:hypothetical protein